VLCRVCVVVSVGRSRSVESRVHVGIQPTGSAFQILFVVDGRHDIISYFVVGVFLLKRCKVNQAMLQYRKARF